MHEHTDAHRDAHVWAAPLHHLPHMQDVHPGGWGTGAGSCSNALSTDAAAASCALWLICK